MVNVSGDTMTVLNADDLDHCTILWATVAYTVANMDTILPRTGDAYVNAGVTMSHSPLLTIIAFVAIVLFNARFCATPGLSHFL